MRAALLITAVCISCPASSRSNYSNARLYRPGSRRRTATVPGSWSSRGLGLGRKHYSRLKPEGEVNWELGGTTGRFWTALQRRRHQMAGWVAHGMAIGTLQLLPRSKVRHAHAHVHGLAGFLPKVMRKRLQSMTFATNPGRREHRGSGYPPWADWAESTSLGTSLRKCALAVAAV